MGLHLTRPFERKDCSESDSSSPTARIRSHLFSKGWRSLLLQLHQRLLLFFFSVENGSCGIIGLCCSVVPHPDEEVPQVLFILIQVPALTLVLTPPLSAIDPGSSGSGNGSCGPPVDTSSPLLFWIRKHLRDLTRKGCSVSYEPPHP